MIFMTTQFPPHHVHGYGCRGCAGLPSLEFPSHTHSSSLDPGSPRTCPPSSLGVIFSGSVGLAAPARNVQQGSRVTLLQSSHCRSSFRQFSLPGQFSTVAKTANACHLSGINGLRSSRHHLSRVGAENG